MAKITPLIISSILFIGVLIGLMSFYADIQNTYSPANSTSETEFEKFQEYFNDTSELMGKLQNKTSAVAQKKDLSRFNDILFVFVDVIGILLKFPGLMINFISHALNIMMPAITGDSSGNFGWFIFIVTSVIVVAFVMRVVDIFTKTSET